MEEFNISEFIKYYFSQIAIVIIFIIFGLLGCWYYTDNIQVAEYKSQTSLVLTSGTDKITQNDITVNKNLVSTYREIIKSRRILSPVIENLQLDLTTEELSKKIAVTSTNDTEIIVITVTDTDSIKARDIANEIAKVFQKDIANIIPIDNISLVDEAVEANEPYNVNVLKQYIIGVGAGFLIGSMIITIMFYFDDSIKRPEDIEEKVGLSVLSTVPKYKNKNKSKRK
ncbi:MAG: Wzz/FepE/Etk N-terminal domain-containing protein [Tenericutes bacterium]|nr:Wzz/FepE/Etk N-terminal domain-containing protein [Mycoplasmatota bacterium]